MYCWKCGALIEDGAKFCERCGSEVDDIKEDLGNEALKEDIAEEPMPNSGISTTENYPGKKARIGILLGLAALISVLILILHRGHNEGIGRDSHSEGIAAPAVSARGITEEISAPAQPARAATADPGGTSHIEMPKYSFNNDIWNFRGMSVLKFKENYGDILEFQHNDRYGAEVPGSDYYLYYIASGYDYDDGMSFLLDDDKANIVMGDIRDLINGYDDKLSPEEFGRAIQPDGGAPTECTIEGSGGTAYYVAYSKFAKILFDSDADGYLDTRIDISLDNSDCIEPDSFAWLYLKNDFAGECGDGLKWQISEKNNDSTLYISGTGAMDDFTFDDGEDGYVDIPWFDKKESIRKVVIQDGVTSIGDTAFAYLAMTSIEIPDSVQEIGDSAFMYCTDLKNLYIPNGIRSLGREVFWGCYSLESIRIPRSLKSIGESAFFYDSDLTRILYEGAIADWEQISIADGNEAIFNATKYYSPSPSLESAAGNRNDFEETDEYEVRDLVRRYYENLQNGRIEDSVKCLTPELQEQYSIGVEVGKRVDEYFGLSDIPYSNPALGAILSYSLYGYRLVVDGISLNESGTEGNYYVVVYAEDQNDKVATFSGKVTKVGEDWYISY
ncbi:MAG: leucine-rich repeat protein [Lachnospiraceae bacterium]|nr:leucine-rich repeat protein [Lachnospiraceae bacterium]